MSNASVAIVETGSANLASVRAAFARMGIGAVTTGDADVIRRAHRVVVPGVGAFGDVMERLVQRGVADALVERCNAGAPMLAICLGLQVLAAGSEESPGVAGLGVLTQIAKRFPSEYTAPQLGWNCVTRTPRSELVRDGYAYFANSYYLESADDTWTPSWSTHGVPFVAALERGPQLACQFHPELSGAWGAQLLERWVASC